MRYYKDHSDMQSEDLRSESGVILYMHDATSEADWQRRANTVRAAHGGQFPLWWNQCMIDSGFAAWSAQWNADHNAR